MSSSYHTYVTALELYKFIDYYPSASTGDSITEVPDSDAEVLGDIAISTAQWVDNYCRRFFFESGNETASSQIFKVGVGGYAATWDYPENHPPSSMLWSPSAKGPWSDLEDDQWDFSPTTPEYSHPHTGVILRGINDGYLQMNTKWGWEHTPRAVKMACLLTGQRESNYWESHELEFSAGLAVDIEVRRLLSPLRRLDK